MRKHKSFRSLMLLLVFVLFPVTLVSAETVYYRGTPVNWEHSRRWVVYSFSDVQSHQYEHCSTANSVFSGWKKKGVLAQAQDYVGRRQAVAYWDCR